MGSCSLVVSKEIKSQKLLGKCGKYGKMVTVKDNQEQNSQVEKLVTNMG